MSFVKSVGWLHKDLTKEQERVHRVIKVINDEKTRLAEQVEEKSRKTKTAIKGIQRDQNQPGILRELVWESIRRNCGQPRQELMIRNNELQNSNERVAVLEKMG